MKYERIIMTIETVSKNNVPTNSYKCELNVFDYFNEFILNIVLTRLYLYHTVSL